MGAKKRLAHDNLEAARAKLGHACRALKVFPLPGVVVFPGTPAPFHIFEPRYRELTADALVGDGMLAVATLASEEGATEDRAPLHPIAGAGFIEAQERLDDGRYQIVVRGVARVRLVTEIDNGKPYREFRAELLEDVYPEGSERAVEAGRTALESCVLRLVDLLPAESGARQLADAAARMPSASALADLVAAAVVSEAGPRVAVIEELDVLKRLDLVTSEVASVILMLSRGKTPKA